jgi:hypothetical protein
MEPNTENIINTPQFDTNVEYISAKGVHDQPPIINSVFKSIFVETPKDFFSSIKNFFLRFANLFKDGFKYLKYPSLKIDPFATKDYKESCQHTFEFALIVIALLIFLIKMDWIYGDEKLKEVYNNDISQALIQFFIFLCFAVSYFVLIVVAVLTGRLFRILYKIPITRQESDILFTYLNNIFFIITATVAFFLRCIVPTENVIDDTTAPWIVLVFYAVVFGFMVFRWAGRFVLLNNLKTTSVASFKIVVTIVTLLLFSVCSTLITFFIWGV